MDNNKAKNAQNMENISSFSNRHYRSIIGATLIGVGLMVLFEQYIRTGWLLFLALPMIGLIFLIIGLFTRGLRFIIPGSLVSTSGIGILTFFTLIADRDWMSRVGLLLVCFGCGWLLIGFFSIWISNKIAWWTLIPGSIILSTGLTLLLHRPNWADFIFFIVTGLSLAFLCWGVFTRLFGLIIPGCILVGVGPGIYLAWGTAGEPSNLARVGVMLVVFALGWGLITVFSRILWEDFVWWPLIPGGILAMVGWGLYSGGDPDNAASFIGNTGSIGLIIFGLYLLLMRRGMRP